MTGHFHLDGFIPYRLHRAAETISRGFAEEYKAIYGLTHPEWRALAALGQQGRLTATEIGRQADMHKTQVSRAVTRLAARGWLTRLENPRDRRVEFLDLTEDGLAAFQRLTQVALRYQAQLREQLGIAGSDALERCLTAIEASPSPAP